MGALSGCGSRSSRHTARPSFSGILVQQDDVRQKWGCFFTSCWAVHSFEHFVMLHQLRVRNRIHIRFASATSALGKTAVVARCSMRLE